MSYNDTDPLSPRIIILSKTFLRLTDIFTTQHSKHTSMRLTDIFTTQHSTHTSMRLTDIFTTQHSTHIHSLVHIGYCS